MLLAYIPQIQWGIWFSLLVWQLVFFTATSTTELSQEFGCTSADLGVFVNICDKERQNRYPAEARVQPVQTVATSDPVFEHQWGSSLLQAIFNLNVFPNSRRHTFGDCDMSPLMTFALWWLDLSSLLRFKHVDDLVHGLVQLWNLVWECIVLLRVNGRWFGSLILRHLRPSRPFIENLILHTQNELKLLLQTCYSAKPLT